MDIFIKPVDKLSALINEKANELYGKLLHLPVDQLDLPEAPRNYYQSRHLNRLFFSVQTASIMLYNALLLTKKDWKDVVILEYGAGVGSLFLLTSMIGCKSIIYEDISEEMVDSAQKISRHLGIPINHFITGDIDVTLQELEANDLVCDLIISRNVIEHIYNLDSFYQQVSVAQPQAIIYFSTTANYYNPLMHLYHLNHHRQVEKSKLYGMRKDVIAQNFPMIKGTELEEVTKATRGLAVQDLAQAVTTYTQTKVLPNPKRFYSNTCDPTNGVWYENLLTKAQYKDIIATKGYTLIFEAAFWDTHYNSQLKNFIMKGLNGITQLLGKRAGIYASPFLYIIAIPQQK